MSSLYLLHWLVLIKDWDALDTGVQLACYVMYSFPGVVGGFGIYCCVGALFDLTCFIVPYPLCFCLLLVIAYTTTPLRTFHLTYNNDTVYILSFFRSGLFLRRRFSLVMDFY